MGKEFLLLEMKDNHYKDKPEKLYHLTAEENTILVWVSLDMQVGRVDMNFSESMLSMSILQRLALFPPISLLNAVVVGSLELAVFLPSLLQKWRTFSCEIRNEGYCRDTKP